MSRPAHPPKVLVVGSGLAGMTAAHYLAEWGAPWEAEIILMDRAPHLGGAFGLLDHTYTTDSCGLCIALPRQPSYCPTIACERHPNITPLPSTTLAGLDGDVGGFGATLRQSPRYVDPDRCDCCGLCATVCPVPRPLSRWGRTLSQTDGKTSPEVAIYPPPPRAVPLIYAIDADLCTRCGACVEACPQHAIDLDTTPAERQVEVDALILAPGAVPFDATRAVEYGWGRRANVVTSLEYERMLNRSGPTGGRPLRPSDGQPPRKVAFIQCVGSRNVNLGRPHCATSCCMITCKQVGLTKEVAGLTEVTVFTMDDRAAGKGHERYFQRVSILPGVTYRWGLPAAVREDPATQNLDLLTPDGEQAFDLVVLAVGMGLARDAGDLAARVGVDLDETGLVLPGNNGPGSTSRRGVYAAGSALAPADVSETVTQAAAAAALAAQAISASTRSQSQTEPTTETAVPDGAPAGQQDLVNEPPRIGIFICTCRGTLSETLDLPSLVAESEQLRGVAHVEQVAAACESSGISAIENAVDAHDLNRIVIAGCSASLYADRFDEWMDRLGLPRRLLARAEIREGAAWSHAECATTAAQSQIAIAVAGLRETPYRPFAASAQENVARRVLVLGGGLAGMTAALTLNDLGIECDLVERTAQLGGNLCDMPPALDMAVSGTRSAGYQPADAFTAPYPLASLQLDAQALLSGTLARMQRARDPRTSSAHYVEIASNSRREIGAPQGMRVWTGAELVGWSGVKGDFCAEIRTGTDIHHERYGALIVATGAGQMEPEEYLYGKDERVITQRVLGQMLAQDKMPACQSVVMIQCVGSRDDTHPYCSRLCCTQAVKNALALKAHAPGLQVAILYRDIRTMGPHELLYQQARRAGVLFLRYDTDRKPLVSDSGASGQGLQATAWDTVLGQEITLYPNLVVLSAGIESNPDNDALAQLIDVPLDEDGFFLEAHPKLRPTDLDQPGIYLCGLAYGPRTMAESMAQARAAALRAALTVARPPEPRRNAASVVQKLCSACGLCVTSCPYGARVLVEGSRGTGRRYARVIDHLCQGCGICVAVCPNGASRQAAMEPVSVLARVDAALIE